MFCSHAACGVDTVVGATYEDLDTVDDIVAWHKKAAADPSMALCCPLTVAAAKEALQIQCASGTVPDK